MGELSLSKAQKEVLAEMRNGGRLCWFGNSGPEMSWHSWELQRPFWPQKRTVRILIKKGYLEWVEYDSEINRECGIQELRLSRSKLLRDF